MFNVPFLVFRLNISVGSWLKMRLFWSYIWIHTSFYIGSWVNMRLLVIPFDTVMPLCTPTGLAVVVQQPLGDLHRGYYSTNSIFPCPQVENLLLIVMQSAQLVNQRKAFQQSMDELLTLKREQTSSQPLIARALEQLKVHTSARKASERRAKIGFAWGAELQLAVAAVQESVSMCR